MSDTPEFNEAISTLIKSLKGKSGNFVTWLLLALLGAAPMVLPIISQNRGPGSATFLTDADFHIIGPDRAPVGELVRCTVSDYEPTDVCWFTVGDSERYGLNDSKLVFSVPTPGDVVVTCAIIRQGRLYLTQKVITIGGEIKPPFEPKPGPGPKLDAIGEQIVKLATEFEVGRSDALQIAKNLREAAACAGSSPCDSAAASDPGSSDPAATARMQQGPVHRVLRMG